MAFRFRPFLVGILIMIGGACSREIAYKDQGQRGDMESGVFDDFKYPERYAAIVEAAESGDEKSTLTLARYYANSPKADLRNLEYWSRKASQIKGRDELTNLIVMLASHGECEQAWQIVDNSYPKPNEFDFYTAEGSEEAIDGRCKRLRDST